MYLGPGVDFILSPTLVPMSGMLESCGLTSLRSGHSHEDIDQQFGYLSKYLMRHGRSAEVPADFQRLIQDFLKESHRPHEEKGYSILLEQTRSWTLDSKTNI